MVPELLMAPEKVATFFTKMPSCAAESVPELKMPPPALLPPKVPTAVTWIASKPPEIVPLLLMLPTKVDNALNDHAAKHAGNRAAIADVADEGRNGVDQNRSLI